MEVIKHLECPLNTLKIARILSKGGFLLLTTPNILNLASRIRYFLMAPTSLLVFYPKTLYYLEVATNTLTHSLVYLSFISKKNNFRLKVTIDKLKHSSLFLYYITKPFFLLGKFQTIKRFQKKEKQLYRENKGIIPLMYSKYSLWEDAHH